MPGDPREFSKGVLILSSVASFFVGLNYQKIKNFIQSLKKAFVKK